MIKAFCILFFCSGLAAAPSFGILEEVDAQSLLKKSGELREIRAQQTRIRAEFDREKAELVAAIEANKAVGVALSREIKEQKESIDLLKTSYEASKKRLEDHRQSSAVLAPILSSCAGSFLRLLREDSLPAGQDRLQRMEELALLESSSINSEEDAVLRLWDILRAELAMAESTPVYRGVIPSEGGGEIPVEFLRVGEIALYARRVRQDLNPGQDVYLYKKSNSEYEQLHGAEADAVRDAFDIALRKATPKIVRLPLSIQEESRR